MSEESSVKDGQGHVSRKVNVICEEFGRKPRCVVWGNLHSSESWDSKCVGLQFGVEDAWRQSQGYDTFICRSAFNTIETKYKLESMTEITKKKMPHYLV